jgi:hypothetical protein
LFDDEQRDYTSDTVKPHRPAEDKPVSEGVVSCGASRLLRLLVARRCADAAPRTRLDRAQAYTRPYKYAPAKLADDESSEEEKEHEAKEAK